MSGETYDVIDPTTGEVYASAPMSGAEDVDRAYAAAADAFEGVGDSTPQDRLDALLKIADAIDARADEINAVECKDTGKPLGLTMSEEMPYASDHFRFFAGAARVLEGKSAGEYMADHTSCVRREPIGVVGQVTPWNYPLMMMIWKIAPGPRGRQHHRAQAVATPRRRRSTLLAELAQEFLPPGVLNVVCGDRDTGRALVEHKTPQMVSITGSVRAGMEVAGSAAADLKRVHLELGGKAPVIVFDDADVEEAAEAIAEAGYFNAGQDCTAATRVLAGPGVHDDFVAALTEAAKGIRTGMPDDEDVLYGPLNNANQLARVTGMVDRLPDHATLETGGASQGDTGYFYEPTVLSGLRQDDEQIQTEIFGPVITVQQFSDEAEALRWANGVAVRPGLVGLDQGPRPRHADVEEARLRRASGSTPTSRSSPRCRTVASSTPATARTCRCTASRTTPASSTSCTTSASDLRRWWVRGSSLALLAPQPPKDLVAEA